MARSLAAAQVRPKDADYREVIAWYEDQLERAAPPTDLAWEPVKIGPTWQYDNGWVLPAATLGWRNLAWTGLNLQSPKGGSWTYTLEQARFILWMDALDPETGEFLFPTAVLQRIKGWGKDPIAAAVSLTDICSPDALFSHWDGDVPVGKPMPDPYVQIVGVSQDQIKRNTMPLFRSLPTADAKREYGIQVGKLDVWALGDAAHIEATTSSVGGIEGPRPTRVIRNETQNWTKANGGHDLAGAIDGNSAKSADAVSRTLDICNAYRPGQDSVGQRAREAYDSTVGSRCDAHAGRDDWPECLDCQRPKSVDFGMLYDSLEAPPEAPLTVEAAPSVVEAVRGDSVWLNIKRIMASIKNPSNSASESRRKWYNQITATEDAWADPNDVKAAAVEDRLEPGDTVVLFGDGSKSDDATAIVAVRVSDGLAQVLHVQQPKAGQIVDRGAVDHAVVQAFDTYKVIAFWFDPSHAKDDDSEGDDNSFWRPLCDEWMTRYGKRLKCWPTQSGPKRHAIIFDMASPTQQQLFVAGAGQALEDLESGRVKFARSQWLIEHLINAKRAPGKYGVSLRKEHRESRHKIDLAVCLVGARLLWRQHELSKVGKSGTPGQGRVIVLS